MSTSAGAAGGESWLPGEGRAGLISVVVPVYNRANRVDRALRSVAAQEGVSAECIVVDDGSTDSTLETVRAWISGQSGDVEFRVLTQSNSGGPAARNRGMAESDGEFLCFLDSDDELLPGSLERRRKALEESGLGYSYERSARIDAKGNVVGFWGLPWPAGDPMAYVSYLFHTNSPLIRRAVCRAAGPWDEEIEGCQEEEYFTRLKLAGGPGAYVDEVGHRVHEAGPERIVGSDRHRRAIPVAYSAMLRHLEASALPGLAPAVETFREQVGRRWIDAFHLAMEAGDLAWARECLREIGERCGTSWHSRAVMRLTSSPGRLWLLRPYVYLKRVRFILSGG